MWYDAKPTLLSFAHVVAHCSKCFCFLCFVDPTPTMDGFYLVPWFINQFLKDVSILHKLLQSEIGITESRV
jgi:hypothetical protein